MTLRHRTTALIGAVIVFIALIGVAVAFSQNDDPSPEAKELTGLVEDGRATTYHARYESALADPRADDTVITMEVWRKEKLNRQELTVKSGDTVRRTATFQLASESIRCTKVDDAAWSCEAPSSTSPEAAIEAEFENDATASRDETIAGVDARCFTFSGGKLSEACLTTDGVMARMVTTTSTFELVTLDRTVPEGVFDLPES